MARHTVTGDFMDSIRAHFTAAEAAAEPAGPSAEDVPLSDWAANRAALGIRHQDSDFLGISSNDDDGSGFPSWRTPVVEQVEFTEMDEFSAQRRELGIKKDASDFFGVAPRTPRSNASPWSVI